MSERRNSPATYAEAGVSIEAGNELVRAIGPLVKSTARPGADGTVGGFGGVFDLGATSFRDPLLVAANDGVGTKVKLAIEAGRHDTIGIDLVAMCVNDLIVQGAEPLFFLDYFATAKLEVETAKDVVAGIAEGCRMAGCALLGGETAEMPGLYARDDYDLAGFAVGAVEREALLPRGVGAGDVLIGLPSSGIHSNGYSLVRRLVADADLKPDDPAPFDPALSLSDALLTPTRIYVRGVLAAIGAGGVRGMAHITGGGLIENVPRCLPDSVAAMIHLDALSPPPVFGWLQRAGDVERDEMLRTFNCGVGMVLMVAADAEDRVTQALRAAGEEPFRLGSLVEREGEPVVFAGDVSWN